MSEENKNIYISYWLMLITFLVALMILIGGLTRLTDSGLSITRWDLISGIIPPLSLEDWEKSFSLYKKIPEYKILNLTMTLNEFKVIYWWEYTHRLLGRIIGLFYLLPILYFTYKKSFKNNTLISLYIILILIMLQGFIGWYMVQSGLTERTDVSHYRLSIHLTLAFIILILLFWNYLRIKQIGNFKFNNSLLSYLIIIFISILLIQISVGALVSGLDAGKIYMSWPLMNGNYFPDDSAMRDIFSFTVLENPSVVQFFHRNIAYLIFFLFFVIFVLIYKNINFYYLKFYANFVFAFLFLQIFLGILTIFSGAQIVLASMHQICSIFLLLSSVLLFFKYSKVN